MRTCSFFLIVAIAVVVCTIASPATTKATTCPWRTVANVEDPTIQSIGRWAVEQVHAMIRFDKVESARAQAVGDCASNINCTYELIIDASMRPGAANGKFNALVYVIARTQPKELLSLELEPVKTARGPLPTKRVPQ